MKSLDPKSFIAGLIVGTVGITSILANTSIQSAQYSNSKVMFNGEEIHINNPIVSIIKQNDNNSNLYMPIREILQNLGYVVEWYEKSNTINIINSNNPYDINDTILSKENPIINLKNRASFSMNESGSFEAKDNQILKLEINANLINGSVDFVLFNPSGEQQEFITIKNMSETKTILLSKGSWAYNCSGIFRGGGNCSILGIIQ